MRSKCQSSNLCSHLQKRESMSDGYSEIFKRRCFVDSHLVKRLALSAELKGHGGCVNCIQWNQSGTILASGSDDFRVILWDPFNKRQLHAIRTGHTNNIFAVQFLPNTDDRVVLSGAGDCKVMMHDLNRPSGEECIQTYNCHLFRVKRIAVTPTQPNLFWTAGEDGIVMQFDTRVPPSCDQVCEHALINLNAHLGADAEVKCIAINPCRPEYIAVGANDPYVRVFDRRMLSCKKIAYSERGERNGENRNFLFSPVTNLFAVNGESYDFPQNCAKYYSAGHLPVKYKEFRRKMRPLATTYLTFDPSGKELLVNLGGEQIYLFDISTNKRHSVFYNLREELERAKATIAAQLQESQSKVSCNLSPSGTNGYSNGHINGTAKNGVFNSGSQFSSMLSRTGIPQSNDRQPLPVTAETLKQEANSYFSHGQYVSAIDKYSDAILHAPQSPILYANRAAAYMKRGWDGDMYAALRDCSQTLRLDPNHLKAMFRLARCLNDLSHPVEAQSCLEIFRLKFPDYTKSPAFATLDRDIKDKVFSEASKTGGKSQRKRIRKERSSDNSPDSQRDIDIDAESSSSSRQDQASTQDLFLKQAANDYELRFCGHCNTTTDIKEANFFGRYGEYVIAGSDDGTFFIWDRKTCNIVSVLRGDESIVNCLQPHPTQCLLATSGIESVVKLWSPGSEKDDFNPLRVDDTVKAAMANQRRMNTDPFEVMLYNLYGVGEGGGRADGGEAEESGDNVTSIQCRQS